MYHYLYTNDMRISVLEDRACYFAKLFLDDAVPSADEDKSLNNNANTIGFYLNLIKKGQCAKLAASGDVRSVILNFIKKFQYPNARTKENLLECKNDGIRLAPLREVVKLLFVAKQISSNEVYLTTEEVLDFIFYNDEVAKSKQINRYKVYLDILKSRKGEKRGSNIANYNARVWKQQERQIKELLSILSCSGFIEYSDGKVILKDIKEESSTLKAEIFDILTYEEYWDYEISDSLKINDAKNSYFNYFDKGVVNKEIDVSSDFKFELPHQRIFFGAPGTGKSYLLNKEAKENFGDNFERVTFHPNYMYGNFIGTFKPFPVKIKGENGSYYDEFGNVKENITYKYVPGVLMRILIKSLLNPHKNYLLIIEEINRANVAAVFGDFFQLLDRNLNGESEYSITTSEEVRVYLQDQLELAHIDEYTRNFIYSKLGKDFSKLILPSNLYIWATMNSADQGVMPMDTAFKRRWEFKYIGVDEATKNTSDFDRYTMKISNDSIVKWNDFRTEVNNILIDCRVPEDKLIGPYFISKSTLECGDVDKITSVVKNKVLMYLYEDAGKAYRNNLFVAEKAKTYSTLCDNFDDNGVGIFNKTFDIESIEIDSGNNECKQIIYEKDIVDKNYGGSNDVSDENLDYSSNK
ncbi:ATPase [[Clostridium] sordellii]|uniref:AAA family ATPase n=1 Tax=Paraclostridium sordellii TaxID=1505 RepID=UPI0005E3A8A3|nr:AAA family ATPase [Paeniclostridium sordellii]CEQ11096.1 ATPase [[Clostridium] sordellii] [Paeniclostridium sordellii]